MISYNLNNIQNTNVLPTTNVEVLAATKNSFSDFKILVTNKAMPMCPICLSLPEEPVTLCKNIETNFLKKHLLCRKCATSPITKLYITTCPVCNQENFASPQLEHDAAEFIEQIKLNSLYLCPKACDKIIKKADINNHIVTCLGKGSCSKDFSNETTSNIEHTESLNSKREYNAIHRNLEICTDCKTNIPRINLTVHKKKCLQAMVVVHEKSSTGLLADLPVRKWLYNEKNNFSNIFRISKLENIHKFGTGSRFQYYSINFSLNSLEDSDGLCCKFSTYAQHPTVAKRLIEYSNSVFIDSNTKLLSILLKNSYILDFNNIPQRYKRDDRAHWSEEDMGVYFNKQRFTVAISPQIADDCSYIVCKKIFSQTDINTYNSMYTYGTAPQKIIDLFEFFTANGIAQKHYVGKYGADLEWQLKVVVEDI